MKPQLRRCLYVLIAFAALQPPAAKAQNASPADYTDSYLLDFSVPDMPAFKALGTDPSSILRPSDIQKFAAMISPFYTNGKGVFPKNFALEAAPWKLASKNMRLTQYRGFNRILYNTGFSLGSIRDSTSNSSKIALGMRISLIPKHKDILWVGPRVLQNAASQRLSQTNFAVRKMALLNAFKQDAAINREAFPVDSFDAFIKAINTDETPFSDPLKAAWHQITAIIGPDIPDSQATALRLSEVYYRVVAKPILDSLKAIWNDTGWNNNRYDIAIAYIAESPDSLIKTSQFSSFQFWGTAAWRTGKASQLLLGTNIIIPRAELASTLRYNITANLREYVGTKDFRGFLEAQYKYQNYGIIDKSLLINLGAEFRLLNSFWITASGGINNYFGLSDPLSKLVSGIDIRYGFNRPSK